MSRLYGKIPRKVHQAQQQASAEIQINITGRRTLEQLSFELQRLHEHGVYVVQRVRMRLEPLDEKGEAMSAYAEDGKPVQLIQIPDVPLPPPESLGVASE